MQQAGSNLSVEHLARAGKLRRPTGWPKLARELSGVRQRHWAGERQRGVAVFVVRLGIRVVVACCCAQLWRQPG